ncbi:MAG TPA: ABC transporter ATP-binding protein [Hyphomicrobiaceae bacterium]|nr:ABC transporter ATP-binding protein [Hyphomicrobiaceae bacterium]
MAAAAKTADEAGGALLVQNIRLAGQAVPLSFAASPRALVAVTGNAAARSELLAVIARLNAPGSGAVTLDGVPIHSLSTRHFCHAISLVSPALPLVPGSVRENLAAGIEPVDDEVLVAALSRCRLIGQLPNGLDTRIRVFGDGLAAGIKARVALTRALVRAPRVLVIDDPLLLADPDGRAALSELAVARERTMLVALDDRRALGAMDREWTIPSKPSAGASYDSMLSPPVESFARAAERSHRGRAASSQS